MQSRPKPLPEINHGLLITLEQLVYPILLRIVVHAPATEDLTWDCLPPSNLAAADFVGKRANWVVVDEKRRSLPLHVSVKVDDVVEILLLQAGQNRRRPDTTPAADDPRNE